jgi:hypothetical protein
VDDHPARRDLDQPALPDRARGPDVRGRRDPRAPDVGARRAGQREAHQRGSRLMALAVGRYVEAPVARTRSGPLGQEGSARRSTTSRRSSPRSRRRCRRSSSRRPRSSARSRPRGSSQGRRGARLRAWNGRRTWHPARSSARSGPGTSAPRTDLVVTGRVDFKAVDPTRPSTLREARRDGLGPDEREHRQGLGALRGLRAVPRGPRSSPSAGVRPANLKTSRSRLPR